MDKGKPCELMWMPAHIQIILGLRLGPGEHLGMLHLKKGRVNLP